jgi:hypothetical protein
MPVCLWYVGHQKTFRPSSSAVRTIVVTWSLATGSRRRVAGPARSTGSGGRQRSTGTPSRSPARIGMRIGPRSLPVIVAASPVPVGTPTRVPEITWAPLRERARLSLSLDSSAGTDQSQTGGNYGCSCGPARDIFHASVLPIQLRLKLRIRAGCTFSPSRVRPFARQRDAMRGSRLYGAI